MTSLVFHDGIRDPGWVAWHTKVGRKPAVRTLSMPYRGFVIEPAE
jgi:hypothetical protein